MLRPVSSPMSSPWCVCVCWYLSGEHPIESPISIASLLLSDLGPPALRPPANPPARQFAQNLQASIGPNTNRCGRCRRCCDDSGLVPKPKPYRRAPYVMTDMESQGHKAVKRGGHRSHSASARRRWRATETSRERSPGRPPAAQGRATSRRRRQTTALHDARRWQTTALHDARQKATRRPAQGASQGGRTSLPYGQT